MLALGWTALPGSPWLWTLAALAVPAIPLWQLVIGTLLGTARSLSLEPLKRWRDSLPAAVGQVRVVPLVVSSAGDVKTRARTPGDLRRHACC